MKYIGIALALTISPLVIGMDRPSNWQPPKQASKRPEFDKKQTQCAICTDDMISGEEYSCTPCQHAFHYECFKPFSTSQTKNRCPLCRAPLSDQLLATMRAKPSGKIIKNEDSTKKNDSASANQEVGFFRKMMRVLSGSDNTSTTNQTPEQKMKQLTDALLEAQKRITANQDQISQLIKQKANLEGKLQETKKEFQEFRLIKPELVRIDSYKKNIEDLAIKNQLLSDTLGAAEHQCEVLRGIRSGLTMRIAQQNQENELLALRNRDLQNANERQANSIRVQIETHDALRRRILYTAALGSGIGGGILASRYIKSYPKLAGLLSGASLLAATYWAGSSYCDDLLRWDRNNAV
jgi:hypothetical protein